MLRAASLLFGVAGAVTPSAHAVEPAAFVVEGDGIEASLTGSSGDSERGRAVVADRTRSMCVLCHAGPFAEPRVAGNLGPPLDGVGTRLTPSQLRLRLVDPVRVAPDTPMPAYFRTEGLTRVGRAWAGRPILSAAEIEDAVAYLATLKDGAPG